jgi:tetratricopeptide (TPR) repeat protein
VSTGRPIIPALRTIRITRTTRRTIDPFLHAALAAVLCAFLLPLTAYAYTAEASRHFESGKQAFATQNYAAALDAFEAAAAAGMTGPVVHFNIGVCAYRVGQWSKAAAAFNETARTPAMASLAHYNLGLVALAENKQDQAASWFARAQREAADERLRSLANEQLARLPQPVERNWLAYGSFAAGYDDNVALVSGGDVLGVSGTDDTFAELQFAATAPLTGPWRFDAGLVYLDYQDLDTFDQLSLNTGARYRLPLGDWKGEAGVQLAYSTLDGEGFESKAMAIVQATRSLTDEWRLRVRYRFSGIDGLDGFGGLDGTRHELGVRGTWRRGSWDVDVEYRFDSSDYQDETLSLDRHRLSVDAQRDLDDNWTIEAGLSLDRSSYDVAANASEDRTELVLGVSRKLGTQFRAVARYEYADNRAELREFDYHRNRISAGIEANW